MKNEIKPMHDCWVNFHYKTYQGQAKIYDKASIYGIGSGRVSKLSINNSKGKWVFNYDRGLDFSKLSSKALIGILDFITTPKE